MTPERADECRALLEIARRGKASADELQALSEMVEEALRELLEVESGKLRPRERPRGHARVRRAVAVQLSWAGAETQRGLTLDIGAGGFCALLPSAPGRDVIAVATLRLGSETLTCSARVVDLRERRGSARVSVAFVGLRAEDRVRLQQFLVEDALTQLGLVKGRAAAGVSSEPRPKLVIAR